MTSAPTTRRGILIAGAGAALGAGLARVSPAAASPRERSRSLRFAHLTDSHIQPELGADAGVAACLRHIQSQPDAPSLLVTGGDLIMDSFAQGFDRTKQQWDLFTATLRRESSLNVRHCIGNHDIWGWNKGKSKTTGDEKGWGKAWAKEVLSLDHAYYSFSQNGWKFVVLDSVQPSGNAYLGGLDDAQFEWLSSELSRDAATPTIIISHIPIYSIVAMIADGKLEDNQFKLPAASVFKDGARVHRLLRGHRQVKACISGHIHMNERIELDGISYICDGAVCGAWWKGRKERCGEGYGLFDLFDDGSFTHQYVEFGWEARA